MVSANIIIINKTNTTIVYHSCDGSDSRIGSTIPPNGCVEIETSRLIGTIGTSMFTMDIIYDSGINIVDCDDPSQIVSGCSSEFANNCSTDYVFIICNPGEGDR